MALLAGELREKILFERPVSVPIGGGGFDTEYEYLKETFAAVIEGRSRGELIASQDNIINSIHFAIRYRSDIFFQISDRITWRGFTYIINNFKVDPLRTRIDIYVDAEMDTSSREPMTT